MNFDQQKKLITLEQAAEKLGVSVQMLLTWNEHQILKPTITLDGAIGYTQQQLEQFQAIRGLLQTNKISAHQAANNPILPPPSLPKAGTLNQELTYTKLPKEDEDMERKEINLSFFSFGAVLTVICVILFLVATQGALQFSLSQPKNAQLGNSQTTALPQQVAFVSPTQVKSDITQNSDSKAQSVFQQKNTASQVFYAKAEQKVSQATMRSILATETAIVKPNYADSGIATASSDSYASSVGSYNCPTCNSDKNSVFDQTGNIKGNAGKDILNAMEGVGAIAGIATANQQNMVLESASVLLFFGLFSLWVFSRRKYIYDVVHPNFALPVSYEKRQEMVLPKILEIDQKTDGSVVLYLQNKEYKISKPELYSESDQFISRLMELSQSGNKEMEYIAAQDEKVKLTSPLSRLVTRLGFVGIKRDLFFPRTAKDRVLFRRYLTQEDLDDMDLTVEQITKDLVIPS